MFKSTEAVQESFSEEPGNVFMKTNSIDINIII